MQLKTNNDTGTNTKFVPLRKRAVGCRQLYQTNKSRLVRCYQYYNCDKAASFKKNSNLKLKLKWFGRGFGAKNKKQAFLKLLKLLGFIVCLLNCCGPVLATNEEELRKRLKPLFIEHIRPHVEQSFSHFKGHSSLLKTTWANYASSSNATSGLPTPESPRSPFVGHNAPASSPGINVSPNLVRVDSAPNSLASPRSSIDSGANSLASTRSNIDTDIIPPLNGADVEVDCPPSDGVSIKLLVVAIGEILRMYCRYRRVSACKQIALEKLESQIKNVADICSRLEDESLPEIQDERVFETQPLKWSNPSPVICKFVFHNRRPLYNTLVQLSDFSNAQVVNIIFFIIINVIIVLIIKRVEARNKKKSSE